MRKYNRFYMFGKVKELIRRQSFNEWITVVIMSVIIATVNILHVIVGLAKTPLGYVYLATGHYYLDYFEYLSPIAQGLAGRWLPLNYLSHNDPTICFFFMPYIILGKIAWIFHLSPITVYWLGVFFLTIVLLMCFYLTIRIMLNKEALYVRIIAFLIAIFTGPFYKIVRLNGQFNFSSYDFWYGPSFFSRRFELVPYHLLSVLILLIIIILLSNTLSKISALTFSIIIKKSLIVSILLAMLITFSPFSILTLFPALFVTSGIYYLYEKKNRYKIILYNMTVFIIVLPIGLAIKTYSGTSDFLQRISSLEVLWNTRVSLGFLLLNTGPVILLLPFGLYDYLKTNNFMRRMVFIFTAISYVLFFSSVALYLGTHNLRFFSSINYLCFGVIAALGLKKIGRTLKINNKVIVIFAMILITYSCLLIINDLKLRLSGLDSRTPETILTYIPKSLVAGLSLLKNYSDNNSVLTGPNAQIGMLVPFLGSKRVYIGRELTTDHIKDKQLIADRFFRAEMTKEEAKSFLKTNNLGFVVLTYLDVYDANNLNQYTFLKPIIKNSVIAIWKVN